MVWHSCCRRRPFRLTVIFNKQGEVFSRMNGFIPERFVDMLTDRIREALGEKAAVQATSQ